MKKLTLKRRSLPRKPSALIRIALADLKKAEHSGKYEVDMAVWHTPHWNDPNTCRVCFAGSVMAFSLGIPHGRETKPASLRRFDDFEKKMLALNAFRSGGISEGMHMLGYNQDHIRKAGQAITGADIIERDWMGHHKSRSVSVRADMPDYCLNPALFRKRMQWIAMRLARVGF